MYFPHIDGLRAVAVTSVVLYHLNSAWLPGGFSGVDIFFVISGFVVTASLNSLNRVNLIDFISFFYARRLLRIIPALLLCLLATTLVTAMFIPNAWLSDGVQRTGMFAFLGLSNFILARTTNDYFSPVAEYNPYTHTWSLGVEEQFYVIFPLLFFAWTYRGKYRLFVTALFATAFLLSIVCSGWWGSTDQVSAFYMIPSRFWELAAGALLFQGMVLAGWDFEKKSYTASSKWSLPGTMLSLLLLGYGLLTSQPAAFPYPGAVPTVIGTLGVLFFLFMQDTGTPASRILCSTPFLFIGRLSYSIYLWHWPVIVLFRWTIGIEKTWQILLAAALTMLLSMASFYCVEKPVRYSHRTKTARKHIIIAGMLVCIGIATVVANRIQAKQNSLSLSVTKNISAWYPHGADTDPDFPGRVIQTHITALAQGALVRYSLPDTGLPLSSPDVYVIGDSHADAFTAMFKRYVLETGAAVHMYTNAGCSFLSFKGDEPTAYCKSSSEIAVSDMLTRLKPDDVVFLPSLRLARFCDQWGTLPPEMVDGFMTSPHAVKVRGQEEEYAKTVFSLIEEKGARVVLEAPKPIFKAPAFRCSDWFNAMNPICKHGLQINRQELEDLRRPVLESYERLTQAKPHVFVWDPFPIVCPENAEVCDASDGNPLFFDGDHMSGYGNMVLYPYFRRKMESISKGTP